jgi:hypothetical protein
MRQGIEHLIEDGTHGQIILPGRKIDSLFTRFETGASEGIEIKCS